MSYDYDYEDSLEQQWDKNHSCVYKVDVPVKLTITVEGYDTDEPVDLHDKIDCAIYDMCEVLYHNRITKFFINMERDLDDPIVVRDVG